MDVPGIHTQPSSFETSHRLGIFLSSTPLLSRAWNQCNKANSSLAGNFLVEVIDGVVYIAFSGVQPVNVSNPSNPFSGGFGETPIDGNNDLFFSIKDYNSNPSLVHGYFLHTFLSIYKNPNFKNQVLTAISRSKTVILTGHSVGGTTASLAAIWMLGLPWAMKLSLLCITFGSPLLGNDSLAQAILRERWGGKFCHVVLKQDPVPRLLFSPLAPISVQLNYLFGFWQFSVRFPEEKHTVGLSEEEKIGFCNWVLKHVGEVAENGVWQSPYRPFGSYLFCSEEGAICIENPTAVVKMFYYLMFGTGSVDRCIREHVIYGEMLGRVSDQLMRRKSFTETRLESANGDGVSSALAAAGLENQQCESSIAAAAAECLRSARQMGRRPNLNSAGLAIQLAKITPARAQIEWYKTTCEEHRHHQDRLPIGYYDTFKLRKSPVKDSKVNMNRIKLANFWDRIIEMLKSNQLPHDFHKRNKWINSSQFYKLLVEPLDIAEHYRSNEHRKVGGGHYLSHGRPKRYILFDSWWVEREKTRSEWANNQKKRTKWAGLTQDSCFWALVEEAREGVAEMERLIGECSRDRESDRERLGQLRDKLVGFENYSRGLVERKEVSKDVMLPGSGYSLLIEEWNRVKMALDFDSFYDSGMRDAEMFE